MRNKKIFNNLFDSICLTLLLTICIVFYLFIIKFGVINAEAETNPIATLILSTLIFGTMSIITIVLIIKFCYEYWYLNDNEIQSKKLFREKVVISTREIEKVERKVVSAFVMSTYKSDAFIIYSKNKKIVILINSKKIEDLEFELNKFITK